MAVTDFSVELVGFKDIWLGIFLWVLYSSLFVHTVAAIACFFSLHKHKQGRWYFLAIAIMGIVMPITGGALTSAVIAGVYQSLAWSMSALFALLWGVGQTAVVIVLSFTRLLPTL